MEHRPPATSTGKYVFWSFLTALSLILLFIMTSYLGIMGTAALFGLALVIYGKIKYGSLIKAWEDGRLSSLLQQQQRPARNIPSYQPSRPSSYEQGYQQQPSRPGAGTVPKEDPPTADEQPQAQYPEQMPPMG